MLARLRSAVARLRALPSGVWGTLSQLGTGFGSAWPFPPASAGRVVQSADDALKLSPFWCGVRLYATALSALPLKVYERKDDGTRPEASDHPASWVFGFRPNPAMSRAVFFDLVACRFWLDGEFFAQIRRANNGVVLGCYPIPKAYVRTVLVDSEWRKALVLQNGDTLFDDEFIHVIAYSRDGVRGVPVWEVAGESLGGMRAAQEAAAAYYENAVKPSGYLSYPRRLNKDNLEEIKAYFKAEYAGVGNAGKVPILVEGGDFKPFPFASAEEARLVEQQNLSADEVARWLNVSPLQLFQLQRGTYSNLGADNVAFYTRSLRPILEKIELELDYALFGMSLRYFLKFSVASILKGDPKQQAEVANIGIQNGSVTRNEQREWLDLEPIDGLDEPLTPLNMDRGRGTDDDADPGRERPPGGRE